MGAERIEKLNGWAQQAESNEFTHRLEREKPPRGGFFAAQQMMSLDGTFETWRPTLRCPFPGEDRKHSADDQNDAIDPFWKFCPSPRAARYALMKPI